MAGLDIPVRGEPRHMGLSRPRPGGLRDDVPLTIDFSYELLLPPRGARASSSAGARTRSRTWPSMHCGGCRWSSTCRSRAAGGATTRSAPTTTRSSASRPTRGASCTRRDSPGTASSRRRGGRAPRAADPRGGAGARPRRVRAGALRARRAARRALRRLAKRVTGRPPFRPLHRRTVSSKGSCTSAGLQPTSAAPGARRNVCDRGARRASGSGEKNPRRAEKFSSALWPGASDAEPATLRRVVDQRRSRRSRVSRRLALTTHQSAALRYDGGCASKNAQASGRPRKRALRHRARGSAGLLVRVDARAVRAPPRERREPGRAASARPRRAPLRARR